MKKTTKTLSPRKPSPVMDGYETTPEFPTGLPRKRTKPDRFTPRQVIDALRKGGGFVSQAAKILSCDRSVIAEYLKRYPEIEVIREDIDEEYIDFTEAKLIECIREKNLSAITFLLSRKGKHRGWVERTELTGADNQPITFNVVTSPSAPEPTVIERGGEDEQ